MQLINDLFTGILSSFKPVVTKDGDVVKEVVITHTSKNEPDQDFLDGFDEEFQTNVERCLNNPQWDNIKFSHIIPGLRIKFDGDAVEFEAKMVGLKITQKETPKDLIFKYDIVFHKEQDKDMDTFFENYIKHKEEDEDGKMYLVEYDIEVRND